MHIVGLNIFIFDAKLPDHCNNCADLCIVIGTGFIQRHIVGFNAHGNHHFIRSNFHFGIAANTDRPPRIVTLREGCLKT